MTRRFQVAKWGKNLALYLPVPVMAMLIAASSPLRAQDDIRVRIEPGITCAADQGAATEHGYNHCLQNQRFSVGFTTVFHPGSAAWHFGQRAGASGHWWHTDSTIAFWLYSPDNVESIMKVLDGRQVNGHWWLDFAVMSDVLTRTAVFPNDSTSTDPGPGDGWWIETGKLRELEIFDSPALGICAYPMDHKWSTIQPPPGTGVERCSIFSTGTTLSLRDAWNADGSIPRKYYR